MLNVQQIHDNRNYNTESIKQQYQGLNNPPHLAEQCRPPSQVSDVLAHINVELSKQSSIIEELVKRISPIIKREPQLAQDNKKDIDISYSAELPQELNIQILQKLKVHNQSIIDTLQLIAL